MGLVGPGQRSVDRCSRSHSRTFPRTLLDVSHTSNLRFLPLIVKDDGVVCLFLRQPHSCGRAKPGVLSIWAKYRWAVKFLSSSKLRYLLKMCTVAYNTMHSRSSALHSAVHRFSSHRLLAVGWSCFRFYNEGSRSRRNTWKFKFHFLCILCLLFHIIYIILLPISELLSEVFVQCCFQATKQSYSLYVLPYASSLEVIWWHFFTLCYQ